MEAGQGGQVINVSSGFGLVGAPGVIGYCTSKFAVVGLTEALRAELAPHGIGVTTICPGFINTRIKDNIRWKGAASGSSRVQKLWARRNYPAGSSNGSQSHGQSQLGPRCCWLTSRRQTWIR